MISSQISHTFIAILFLVLFSEAKPSCDRNSLSICYNQLQPFLITNNLRLVLRGSLPLTISGSNKQGRSQQSSSALALPLHLIFKEFKEFCNLHETFAECLEAYEASGCMDADLIGELNNVVVTVARRDRSNGAQMQTSPWDLVRDFDHYRRLAKGYCVDTSENMKIHVVRCLAHAIASSSSTLDNSKGSTSTWPDSQLMYIDGTASSLTGSTAVTCAKWLKQSQGPLLKAFFRQDGCGEHLEMAKKLSPFLAELTMRTTNATEANTEAKYGICVRHVSGRIFEHLINETFHELVSPTVPTTEQPSSTILVKQFKDSEEELNREARFPVVSIDEPTRTPDDESIDYPWLQKPSAQSVVIPMTVDSKLSSSRKFQQNGIDDVDAAYDDSSVLGVSMMMADAPHAASSQPRSSETAAMGNRPFGRSATSQQTTPSSVLLLLLLIAQSASTILCL